MALRYRQPLCAMLRPGLGRWTTSSGGAAVADNSVPEGPGVRSREIARLEAVLLLSQQPQNSRKLAQLAGLADGTKARTLVRALNRLYDGQGSAFRVEEVAGGFQLLSRPKFAPWLRRLQGTRREVRLSAPAMETLAVVAYRQPVVRAEIEAIRGVQCGEILRQLIERDLVRIAGRSQELGRPFLYGTTKYFLRIFGLRHIEDLPRGELLNAEGANVADNELSGKQDEIEEETEMTTTTTAAVLAQDEQSQEELHDDTRTAQVESQMPEEDSDPDDSDLDDDDHEADFDDDFDEDYEEEEEEYEEEYEDDEDEEDDDEEYEYEDEDEDEDDEGFEDEEWEEVDEDELEDEDESDDEEDDEEYEYVYEDDDEEEDDEEYEYEDEEEEE